MFESRAVCGLAVRWQHDLHGLGEPQQDPLTGASAQHGSADAHRQALRRRRRRFGAVPVSVPVKMPRLRLVPVLVPGTVRAVPWGPLLAGAAVSLLVLCYAQASSYFDDPGGGYLYAREAFGSFIGFEVGWMLFLTRIASAAALSNGLAEAVTHFWPGAASGGVRIAIVTGSLAFLVAINIIGVRAAARTGVFLAIAKVLPLLMFIAIGAMFADLSQAAVLTGDIPLGDLGKAALLLLFAYAGFENLPAAAGEYRNPRRDLPFAMLSMIATVTAIYVAVQWVALGTLPGLAESQTPIADAAARFGGSWLVWLVTIGAAVSILGTNSNTIMLGPRYLLALANDGFGPRVLARIHPRFRTPVPAILFIGVGLGVILLEPASKPPVAELAPPVAAQPPVVAPSVEPDPVVEEPLPAEEAPVADTPPAVEEIAIATTPTDLEVFVNDEPVGKSPVKVATNGLQFPAKIRAMLPSGESRLMVLNSPVPALTLDLSMFADQPAAEPEEPKAKPRPKPRPRPKDRPKDKPRPKPPVEEPDDDFRGLRLPALD